MATTINLLEYNNALFRRDNLGRNIKVDDYTTNWSASNASISIVSDVFVTDSRYSIAVFPSTGAAVTLTLASRDLRLFDSGRVLSFNCKMNSDTTCSVQTRLRIVGETTPAPYSQTIQAGDFLAVHSNRVSVPEEEDVYQYTIEITILNHGGNGSVIYFTNMNLIHDLAFYENPFVPQIRRYMPDFYWQYDSEAEHPSYPLYRLIDILSLGGGESRLLYDSFFPFETDEFVGAADQAEFWAKSSLTTPSLVRLDYAGWLAQFTGVKIQKNATLQDGSLYFNNPSMQRDFIEWQLRTKFYGMAAGSRQAIFEAAQQFLVRTRNGAPTTRSVAISTRYLDDPFKILVQTIENETIDAVAGQSSRLVLNSINLAKPVGYQIIHQTVSEFQPLYDNESLMRFDEFRWG